MFDAALSAFNDLTEPNQLCLEIPSSYLASAWEESQSFSSASSRWQAYLNQICLLVILPWLKEEYSPQARPFPSDHALPSFWEVVNGTGLQVDEARFALVPTEAIDFSEFRIPQEWVDIPSWTVDYYLGVQVNVDDGWVKIWGYCTHQQLKTKASYDPSDRTYSLDETDITKDISVLWVTRQLCPQEITKTAVAPLPVLPKAQAENLLQRLGNSSVINPRLAVPFELWGALLAHGGWRQNLYERRLGKPEQWSILEWLQNGVSQMASQLGWQQVEWQPSFAAARGHEATTSAILSRQLAIAGQQYELRIIPQGNLEARILRFELQNLLGTTIPGGFKMRLLTEDLQSFENNEDIATTAVSSLYVDVAVEPGEGLVWEIEPLPENYQQEILKF